jgi:hypothetical protein
MGATLNFRSGMAYEYTLGPNMAAAKSAVGNDPNIIKLVSNSLVVPNQGMEGFRWVRSVLDEWAENATSVQSLLRSPKQCRQRNQVTIGCYRDL